MPLPPSGSTKFQECIQALQELAYNDLNKFAQKLGYAHAQSFATQMKRRGYSRPRYSDPTNPSEEKQPEPVIIMPEIHPYKAPDVGEGEEETQVVVLSDGHAGKITPTFDDDVYKARMERLFQKVITVTHLHRQMYPINRLVILDLGDNITGENPQQGSKIESVSMGARSQVWRLALPATTEFILSARQEFSSVDFYGMGGNHGRYDRLAPETSSWDLALYDNLKSTFGDKYDGITIHSSEEFYILLEIEGHRFFTVHGDEFRNSGTRGIPMMAMLLKIANWFIQYGGFKYFLCGHFHTYDNRLLSAKTELFMNGTLVSDDPWALARLGVSSIPSQWTFGVKRDKGVTWRYPLWFD
jgi:hypothetical protein